MERNMKKVLSKLTLMVFGSTLLTGCFYGSCGDWNCNGPNPRWKKAVDNCGYNNRTIVFQELSNKLGYKSRIEVQDSEIGQHISTQCIRNAGKYDIRKDKQYGHLFVK